MRSVQELCYSWKSRRTLSFQKPIKMLRPTKCAQLSSEIAISNEIVFQFHKIIFCPLKGVVLHIMQCLKIYFIKKRSLFSFHIAQQVNMERWIKLKYILINFIFFQQSRTFGLIGLIMSLPITNFYNICSPFMTIL